VRASALIRSGNYLQAKELFQTVYAANRQFGDLRRAGRTLTYIGACDYGLFRYRDTLRDWMEARRLSERIEDWVNLGSLGVNISGLYLCFGFLGRASSG
jgi:hypothetical protein